MSRFIQKWVNALQEHSAYSSHYLWGGDQRRADSDDDNGNHSHCIYKCITLNIPYVSLSTHCYSNQS